MEPATAAPQAASGHGATRTSSTFNSMSGSGKVTRVKRLDKATKSYIEGTLRRADHRAWCQRHGKTLPPPRLHPVILKVIREWFDLVDDDGSGTLEHHELLGALQAARIPCDESNITEMIKLMDANRDGCIGWTEFEAFMMDEFAAGKHLLSGEYVLPSGMALPFGVMIRQLKRTQMLSEITQGGETRRKWLLYDVNLSEDAKAVANAEEAIRSQKAFNETLHNRVTVEDAGDAAVAELEDLQADLQQLQQQHGLLGDLAEGADDFAAAAAAAAVEAAAARQRGTASEAPGANTAAAAAGGAVAVVAGVPVMMQQHSLSPSVSCPSNAQGTQRHRSSHIGHGALLGDMQATAAAAAASLAATAAAAAAAGFALQPAQSVTQQVPAGAPQSCRAAGPHTGALPVPRLQLSSLAGAGASSGACQAAGSAKQQQQHRQQLEQGAAAEFAFPAAADHSKVQHNVWQVEPGSVLASARGSYWLSDPTAAAAGRAGGAGAASARDCVGDHLYQQAVHKQQLEDTDKAAAAAAAAAVAAAGNGCSASGRYSSTTDHCPAEHYIHAANSPINNVSNSKPAFGSPRSPRSPTPPSRPNQHKFSGSSSSRAAVSPRHVLQPQPCRDEWRVVTASCLAHEISSQSGAGRQPGSPRSSSRAGMRSARGCGSSSSGDKCVFLSLSGGFGSSSGVASPRGTQQQQQQQQSGGTGSFAQLLLDAAATAAAAPPALQQAVHVAQEMQQGSFRDVCVKHLHSARATPAGALLSQEYVGPITAAVVAVHTPRRAVAGAVIDTRNDAAHHQGPPGGSSSSDRSSTARQMRGAPGTYAAAAVAAVATAGGSGQLTPRSARLVVTNAGGALVTEQGKLLRYLPSPRQAVVVASALDGSSSSGCAKAGASGGDNSSSAFGEMWQAGPNAAGAVAAANACSSPRISMFKTDRGAAAGGQAGCGGVRVVGCGKALASPRHSVLAQKLVRVHGSYADTAAASSNVCRQADDGGGSGQISQRGLNEGTGSSGVSSLCRSMQRRQEQQGGMTQQCSQGALTLLPTESSSASASAPMAAASLQQKKQRQQQQRVRMRSAAGSSAGDVYNSASGSGGTFNSLSGSGHTCSSAGARQMAAVSDDGSATSAAAAAAAAAATATKDMHCAASGPLGGRHPAYVNSYMPHPRGNRSPNTSQSGSSSSGAAAATCSYSGAIVSLTGGSSSSGQGCGVVGKSAAGSAAGSRAGSCSSKGAVSPRLCYSGLSPRGRKG